MNKFKKASNGRIVTPKFRLSFNALFERTQYGDGLPYWGCNMVFEDEETDFTDLHKEMNRVIKERWGGKPNGLKNPIRDGIEYQQHDGYDDGKKFCAARNYGIRPIVKDKNGQILLDNDGQIYNGCYCIASITVYAYPGKKNEMKIPKKGIAFQLHQIKKIEEGEPFGAIIDNSGDEFGDDDDFNDGSVAMDDDLLF